MHGNQYIRPRALAILVLIALTSVSCSIEVDEDAQNIIRIPLERRAKSYYYERYPNESPSGMRRVLANSTTMLTNSNQTAYYGQITVGSNNETYSVMFDTGSNALWLPNITCAMCSPNFSHRLNCSTNINCSLKSYLDTINYGDVQVSGQIAKVPIGLKGVNSVHQHFLLVNKTVDLTDFPTDGLFGLSCFNRNNYGDTASSFVNDLYNAGSISKAIFSFYLSFDTSDSELVFGGFDSTKMKNSSAITYHSVQTFGNYDNSIKWTIAGYQINMSNLTVSLGSDSVMIDSGTPNIMLYTSYYNSVVSYLKKNYYVQSVSDKLEFACFQSLPDFTISLYLANGKQQNYTLPQSFYTQKISDERCEVLFESFDGGNAQIILGEVFMRRYLSIFNFADLKIGLTESIAVPPSSSTSFPKWAIYVIAIGGAVLLIVGIVVLIKCKKNKNVQSLKTSLMDKIKSKLGGSSSNNNNNNENHNNNNNNNSNSTGYSSNQSNGNRYEQQAQPQQPYYSSQQTSYEQNYSQNNYNNTHESNNNHHNHHGHHHNHGHHHGHHNINN